MIIKVCTCEQCRAQKRKASLNSKKAIKRLLNKRRRRSLYDTKISNFYWA